MTKINGLIWYLILSGSFQTTFSNRHDGYIFAKIKTDSSTMQVAGPLQCQIINLETDLFSLFDCLRTVHDNKNVLLLGYNVSHCIHCSNNISEIPAMTAAQFRGDLFLKKRKYNFNVTNRHNIKTNYSTKMHLHPE